MAKKKQKRMKRVMLPKDPNAMLSRDEAVEAARKLINERYGREPAKLAIAGATPYLGDLARDGISKFTGIIDSYHVYLNGCVRVGIAPQNMNDGKIIIQHIFDINQIEVLEKKAFKPTIPMPIPVEPVLARQPTGGPMDEPRRAGLPER